MNVEEIVWIADEEANDAEAAVMEVAEAVPTSAPKTNQLVNLEVMNSSYNSHGVAYNKLIPIGTGIQNFSQLTQFNSMSRVLFMESSRACASTSLSLDDKDQDVSIWAGCEEQLADLAIKTESSSDEASDVVLIDNEELPESSQDSCFSVASDHPSEETLSAMGDLYEEAASAHEDIDVKPSLEAGLAQDRESIKKEVVKEDYIKSEYPDLCNGESGEITIKSEVLDFEAHDHEIENASADTTEHFLNNNPTIFTSFCGLPDFSLFNALLEYIADDIEPLKGVTKYEQLFSVLTKLHKNEENLYLNKFIFPAAYVSVVEVLNKNLKVLSKDLPDATSLPAVLTPAFDRSQKVVIFSVLTIRIRFEFQQLPDNLKSVKYLIAYTAFGDVFHVSEAFVDGTPVLNMIHLCGVLKKLDNHHSILLYFGKKLYVTKFYKLHQKNVYKDRFCPMHSIAVQQYTLSVVNRLADNFVILSDCFPEYMLYSKKGNSFLDKIVFVCCMLQNMLPSCSYE